MLKEKSGRLFRRFKRNIRSILLLWIPAGAIAAFFTFILLSVLLTKDASFYSCSQILTKCAQKDPSLWQTTKCAYQAAWCDVNVVWDKMNGKKFPDLPGLPVPDEKAERELFDKMTSDAFLDQRFQEFQAQEEKNAQQTDLPSKEDLKAYMEELRRDRIAFEKEQAEKRRSFAEQLEQSEAGNNNLAGKTAK